MSFSEDCVEFGDQLAKLVDAGVPARDAAEAVGISRQRCYGILRAIGRPVGLPRPSSRVPDQAQVVAVFTATGSINAAAKAAGVTHWMARGVLVDAGLVSPVRQARGKPDAKVRFFELLSAGWSASRAAREVGVHERTARDWRDGIRKVGKTRVHPDGTVTDCTTGTRYTVAVNATISRSAGKVATAAMDGRYLSLTDRLAIADGLRVGLTLTAIAAGIGKGTSTVSREVGRHSIGGLYLPHQATTPPRPIVPVPSSPNWSPTRICARRCTVGCRDDCRPNRSAIASSRISRTTRVCG